jgi:hypothetical protein
MHAGGLAHLGERLLCTQEVIGSSPISSTIDFITWCLSPRAVMAASRTGGRVPTLDPLGEHCVMRFNRELACSNS